MGNTIWKCERWNGSENYINKIEMPARPNVFYFDVRDYVSSDDARALADAIYNELGLGWLPYPENKPEDAKEYFIYTKNIKKASQVFYAQWSVTKDAWLSPFGGLIEDEYCKVIAYMEIPTYQPEDSHES